MVSLCASMYACEKLPTFKKMWDDFVGGKMRLEMISVSFKGAQDLALIKKVRKGGNKGGFGMDQKKEDLRSSNCGRFEPCEVFSVP